MKKISSSFLKSLNWLLTSVLMLLGFSTCDSEPGAAMYGTPHADFTIKGKVVNQENMPIPDIEIKCLVEHHGDNIGLTRYQLFPQILLESFIASLKNFQPTNYGS
mgnify:CR=1 FL=1